MSTWTLELFRNTHTATILDEKRPYLIDSSYLGFQNFGVRRLLGLKSKASPPRSGVDRWGHPSIMDADNPNSIEQKTLRKSLNEQCGE